METPVQTEPSRCCSKVGMGSGALVMPFSSQREQQPKPSSVLLPCCLPATGILLPIVGAPASGGSSWVLGHGAADARGLVPHGQSLAQLVGWGGDTFLTAPVWFAAPKGLNSENPGKKGLNSENPEKEGRREGREVREGGRKEGI